MNVHIVSGRTPATGTGRDGLGRTTASADDPPGSSSVPPGG